MGNDLTDPAVFGRAYDEHSRSVYAAAYRVLGNSAQAQDVVQDVFLRIWRRPRTFDAGRGELGSYLRMMARSRALVTCKLSGKKITCKVRLAKAKRATVKLTRGGRLFARASGKVGRKGTLKVTTLRRPAHGRYKLSVTVTDRKGRVHRLRSTIKL